MLAYHYVKHHAKLIADFRQFYHVTDFRSLDLWTAAELAHELPAESRCLKAENKRLLWSTTDYLLANVVDSINLVAWLNTEAGTKGQDRPEPIERPGKMERAAATGRKEGYTIAEFEARRSMLLTPSNPGDTIAGK